MTTKLAESVPTTPKKIVKYYVEDPDEHTIFFFGEKIELESRKGYFFSNYACWYEKGCYWKMGHRGDIPEELQEDLGNVQFLEATWNEFKDWKKAHTPPKKVIVSYIYNPETHMSYFYGKRITIVFPPLSTYFERPHWIRDGAYWEYDRKDGTEEFITAIHKIKPEVIFTSGTKEEFDKWVASHHFVPKRMKSHK
jgi:hypothetical protein